MAVYFSRRKLRRETVDVGELNIVPYLDIMMNLIMFMLLTMTVLITLGVLNVTAPSYGPSASAGEGDKNKLTLTVAITHQGFFVAGTGGVLPGASADNNQPTLGLKDGQFDYDGLTQKMIDIKKLFPDNTKVILTADANLPYMTLITRSSSTSPSLPV
jgi:biopolymer transport protein TolR